jgi:dihydrofolate reductase
LILAHIAALSKDRVIGTEGRLPWHLPEDLKRFRALTRGKPILLGRKTFESIGRLLPERAHFIVSRQPGFRVEGAEVFASIEEALQVLEKRYPHDQEVFCIGGGEIYRQTLARADRLYLTWVETEVKGDALYPEFSSDAFRELKRERHAGDLTYSFVDYARAT